eukprot:Rhum_TRINITY_DN14473_c9_g1::Rhum_TRINITY_DN14473_c9_g1_i1::g.93380::m.93380
MRPRVAAAQVAPLIARGTSGQAVTQLLPAGERALHRSIAHSGKRRLRRVHAGIVQGHAGAHHLLRLLVHLHPLAGGAAAREAFRDLVVVRAAALRLGTPRERRARHNRGGARRRAGRDGALAQVAPLGIGVRTGGRPAQRNHLVRPAGSGVRRTLRVALLEERVAGGRRAVDLRRVGAALRTLGLDCHPRAGQAAAHLRGAHRLVSRRAALRGLAHLRGARQLAVGARAQVAPLARPGVGGRLPVLNRHLHVRGELAVAERVALGVERRRHLGVERPRHAVARDHVRGVLRHPLAGHAAAHLVGVRRRLVSLRAALQLGARAVRALHLGPGADARVAPLSLPHVGALPAVVELHRRVSNGALILARLAERRSRAVLRRQHVGAVLLLLLVRAVRFGEHNPLAGGAAAHLHRLRVRVLRLLRLVRLGAALQAARDVRRARVRVPGGVLELARIRRAAAVAVPRLAPVRRRRVHRTRPPLEHLLVPAEVALLGTRTRELRRVVARERHGVLPADQRTRALVAEAFQAGAAARLPPDRQLGARHLLRLARGSGGGDGGAAEVRVGLGVTGLRAGLRVRAHRLLCRRGRRRRKGEDRQQGQPHHRWLGWLVCLFGSSNEVQIL